MRKIILLSSLLSIFSSYSLFAQRKNVIKINVLSPLVATFNIQYERALTSKGSLQIGLAVLGYSANDEKKTVFSGVRFTPEYRFYLSDRDAPSGFYIAPFLRITGLGIENNVKEKAEYSSIGSGVTIGYQWLIGNRWALNTFVGPDYNVGSVKTNFREYNPNTDVFGGIGIRAGLTFGIAF